MRPASEWMRDAIGDHLTAEADAVVARATGRHEAEAGLRAARARAALGTGEARERMNDAVGSGALDPASHGALLAHVAFVAEAEVIARRAVRMDLRLADTALLEGVERTISDLVGDLRGAPVERTARAFDALVDLAGRDRDQRLDAWAEVAERRTAIRARGPAAPDDAPDDVAEHCARFLEGTDDAARELVARIHHGAASSVRGLVAHLRALAPAGMDVLATRLGRARRLGRVLEALELDRELAQSVELLDGVLVTARPCIAVGDARAKVITSALELGLPSEAEALGGIAEALARTLASRALPLEHRRAPLGTVARALGRTFSAFFAERGFAARHFDLGPRPAETVRLASTAHRVLSARLACAIAIAPAADDGAREIAARALGLDPSGVPREVARPSRSSALELVTAARVELAALAWAPALRERYDEDFHRNPRFSDFLRGAAARGGTLSTEAVTRELGASLDGAIARVVELAQRAGG